MKKYLLVAAGAALLAGSGVAFAQMPPGSPPGGGPDGGPEMHRGHWGMMHRMHGRGDGAAFFRFKRGDAEMDIKCPMGENVQACVTAAGSLMDKVSGMQPKPQ